MVRLVLFDVDGTLIRTGGAGVKAFSCAFATEFNLPDGAERMSFAGRTDTSLVREYLRLNGITAAPGHFRRFFDCYAFWLDYLLGQYHGGACPGVREFLHQLRALPQPPLLGLLTGNIRLGAEIKLRHYDLWDFFATGAFGDDHEDRNQIARIARQRGDRLLKRRLCNQEIVVVGDTPLDIQCARAINAKALAVATGGAKLDHLKAQQPDWVVEDLRHITAAELNA